MLDERDNTRQTGAPGKAPAPTTAPVTAALPEAIRARLKADVSGADASRANASKSVEALPKADVPPAVGVVSLRNRLAKAAAALPPASAKVLGAARKSAASLAARRPEWSSLSKLPLPQVSPELRENLVKHGRRAGINVGAAIDKIVRARPDAKPSAPAAPGAAADVVTTDLRTVALQRAVKQPSIFAPSHVLTALLAGGIIHIATTFAITALGTGGAFRQLRSALPVNEMVVLPALQPGAQLLPFLQPDMLYAICRFDLSRGAVEVNAILPDVGWSLALYTRQGDNFYAAPGLSQRPVRVAFMLAPVSDRLVNFTPGARKTDVDMSQVTSPDGEGLIVVRAPLKGVAFEGTAKADLRRAACAPANR